MNHPGTAQVEDVLLAVALEKPEADRPAFLTAVCGTDLALRQRLESRLAEQARANPPATAPAQGGLPTVRADVAQGSLGETIGQSLGRYKLLEKIGEGGCGEVYVAEQSEPVRRRVALKVIKLGMDTRQVVARFEAERQALALMDHPNIARVFDAGATQTGRPFFVMELVRGIKITDYCDEHQLSTQERLGLFIQVCRAIQHAHQKGIVHRDIKPSNILVTLHDTVPVPKVIDFGIAKAIEGRLTDATVYTQLHQFMGTPAYMSPEQADLSGLDIDTRSDIYSLGVLLYELLAGCPPFDPNELLKAGLDAMRRAIRENEPVRPSTRLAMLKPDELTATAKRRSIQPPRLIHALKSDLDWITLKCLEKDRQRRYDTANGLAMDLERYLAGQPVIAAPPSPGYRLRKFVTRHRGAVGAACALAALLVAGVVAFAWQASIARHQRDRAVAAEAEAKKRADELAKVSDFQESMLSQINANEAGNSLMQDIRARFRAALDKSGVAEPERAARVESFERELGRVNATDTAAGIIDRTILKPAVKAVEAQFKDQPVDAKLRHGLAELYRILGLYDEALPLHQSALATRRRALGENAPDTFFSLNDMGVVLEAQGKFDEAEQLYRQALEGRRRVLGEDHPDTLTSMSNLGNYLRVRGRYAEAEPLLRSSVEKCRRVLGPDKRDTLICMNCLGFLLISQGKIAEAEPLWRDAYEKGRLALGEDDPDVLVWLNNLAGLLQAQGKLKEAEPYYRQSVEKHRRIRGEEHPTTIQAIAAMAGNLNRQGRFPEAESLYREALDKSRRVLGNGHPETWSCMSNLGNALSQEGRLTEAESLLREALAARRRQMGDDHADTLSAMAQLAQLLANQGKLAEAEELYRETLDKSRQVLGDKHPDTLVRMINLGGVLVQEKRLDQAEPLIRQAVEVRRRVSGEDHPETLVALSNLGRLLELQGKLPEAEALDRDVMTRFRRVLGDDHPNTLNSIASLASVLRSEGKTAEAEPLYREALRGMEHKLGKDHARTAMARLGLGRTLTDLGRFGDAEPELKDAERVLATAQGVPAGRHQQSLEALVALYDAWQKSEPSSSHDAAASDWKRTLEASGNSTSSAKP